MAKAFIDDTHLTDIADAIRATLDESRQYLPSEMAAAIQSVPIMAQLNRKKYFQAVPAGAASGYATIEHIEGNTVKFNQLVQNGDFGNGTNGWSSVFSVPPIVSVTDGILKITKDANGGTGNWYANTTQPTYYSTHKYYIALDAWNEDGETSIGFAFYNANYGLGRNMTINIESNTRRRYSAIGSPQTTGNKWTLRVGSSVTPIGKAGYFANLEIIDLTAIFGEGNEPTTVADFEAWMAQNIGDASYYDYNAGELLSVKMSGMQTEDSSQQTLDTLPFDVTTITGINSNTNTREVMFASGMKQADREGTVKDVLNLRSDTATVNCGYYEISGSESWGALSSYPGVYRIPSRTPSNVANTSGDSIGKCSHYEMCPTRVGVSRILTNGQFGWDQSYYLHIKDDRYADAASFKVYLAAQYAAGTPVTIIYPITPITYTDLQDANGNPLNPRYKVEQGGTEQVLPVNTSTPTTVAPTLTTTYTKDVH